MSGLRLNVEDRVRTAGDTRGALLRRCRRSASQLVTSATRPLTAAHATMPPSSEGVTCIGIVAGRRADQPRSNLPDGAVYHGETMVELDSPRGDESFRGLPMWLQASTWGRGPSYRRAQSLGASALGPPGCLRLEPAGRSWWHTSFSSRQFTSHTNVPTAQACNGILLWAPGARGLLASTIGVWGRITRPFCERAALAGNEQPNGRG